MGNPLRKRYLRDLKRNAGRYISIFLMMTVTIALMSGFFSVTYGVQDAFYQDRKDSKLEDGLFSSSNPLSEEQILNIEKQGITVYENYYVNEAIKEDRVLRVYKNRENVDLVTAMQGYLPKNDEEVAVERLFAKMNHIDLNDTLTVAGTKMKVTGFICMPDYSSLFEKNSNLMMDAFHFGVGIITKEAFERFSNENLIYNYSYLFDNDNLSENEKRELSNRILDALIENKVMLTNFCTAENNNSISFIEDDLGADIPLMKVLLNIIIVIMSFVFSIVISSTIVAEAPMIGTLLASGYKKQELVRHYMGMSIVVTFGSAVIGNLLGYTLMPLLFEDIFYNSYSLPPMEISLNAEALFLTTILPILIMIVVNLVALNYKLSISPLNFLRSDLKRKKNKKAVKLPNLSFLNRFRLRVVLQNKSNYFILFIGIFFASVILMFGLLLTPLINHYVESIKDTAIASYQYILKSPMEIKTSEAAESFTFTSLETYYKPADKDIEVSFYGTKANSKYLSELSIPDETTGVYISDGLMNKLKKDTGDTITFKEPYKGKEYQLEIIGVYEYPSGLAVFMNQNQLNQLLEKEVDYYNGYFANSELTFDNENNLLSVITPEDMAKLGSQMLSSFSQMAPICLGIAIIIYLVLMYTLTKIVIDKNTLYISYMKIFGYERNEIRKLYLSTTTIVVAASLVLGLPLVDITIQKCFEAVMAKISGYLPVYIPLYLYAQIVMIGMVSYLMINFFHKRKVNRIDLATALKNRE